MAEYDVNKLTRLEALKQLAERAKEYFTAKTDFADVSKKVDDIEKAGYKNGTEIQEMITAAIEAFETEVTSDDVINTFKEIVDYIATNGAEFTQVLSDIEGLEELVGESPVSSQITDALKDYVLKDGDKVLSANDYTDEDKAKVDGIEYATDEEIEALLNEIFVSE